MNRRYFTKKCGKFCLSTTIGMAFIQSCQTIARIPYTIQDNKIIVKKTDCEGRKIVIVETDKLPSSIYLNLNDKSNYIALLMQCTHQYCDVIPSGEILHCPCHGSEFSNTGKVLESPATENLQQFKVTINQNHIYIHI